MRKISWQVRASAVALLLSAGMAVGQATNSGDIRGTATDASGALLPGVTVTVTNVNTGITKVIVTNKDGLYDTSSIVVGTYSIKFEKEGFKSFERSHISLEVGVSTVNAKLGVGQVSETVEVNTDLPLLDTESGEQKTTLEAKSMSILPNVGQDWQNFTILLPGTTGASGNTNPGQEISANGNLPYSNVLADGASTTLSHSQNSDVNIFETVSELQVSTSSFSAQYGIGGIIFNQISKGGTSQFHGSAYDYFQSSEFNSIPGQVNPTSIAPTFSHRYNNFGGSIGGPVLLPYVKHKAFFYFNYDQIVSHGANGASGLQDIPTATVMGGDFTGRPTLYDPTTQTIAYDKNGTEYPIRKTFLSEYGCNCIPTSLFDKVSANVQKYYPTPTNHVVSGKFLPGYVDSGGVERQNFQSAVPSSSPYRRYFGRLDYDISPKNRLTISVTQRDTPDFYPNAVTNCPLGCQFGDVESYNPQISDVHTFNSHFINEARIGYTYQGSFYTDEALGAGTAAAIGWQFAKADTFPSIQYYGNYPAAWIGPASNAVYKEHVFDPSDVVTLIHGKNVLHFGGEVLIYEDNSTAWGNTNAGLVGFSGQYTQNWNVTNGVASANGGSGDAYADFLLGDIHNWNANVSPEYGGRLKSPEMFVQDDIKLRPNLTVNLGVRYQIRHGWTEVHGNEATYDPTVTNPATNQPGAYWYGLTHANGRTSLQANSYSTVLPRAGFSWLPHPDMTIRGGFGLYAYNLSLDTYGGDLGNLLNNTGNYTDPTNGVIPAIQFDGPGTEVLTGQALPYTGPSTDPARFNGQSVNYTEYHTPDPKIYQWNLEIQKALGSNMGINLAYVGSHGFNLNFPTDLNQVPTSLMAPNVNNYAKRPNPTFQNISGSTNDAISNYNSFQATIERRLSRGLSFNFNYTWSHFLDDQDSSGWGGRAGTQTRWFADAASNYSNSNFDIRNFFKGMLAYEIPVGRGRMFFNHNSLVDAIFGGYQISSTMQFRSGSPFSVTANQAQSYAESGGGPSPAPNYTGISTTPAGGHTSKLWYNPAAFSLPANGTFGNVRRNSLYGPGLELVNLSAGKKFDIYENVKLQIRLDATNAFNHTSYGTPNGALNVANLQPGQAYPVQAFGTNGAQITSASYAGRTLQAAFRFEF